MTVTIDRLSQDLYVAQAALKSAEVICTEIVAKEFSDIDGPLERAERMTHALYDLVHDTSVSQAQLETAVTALLGHLAAIRRIVDGDGV